MSKSSVIPIILFGSVPLATWVAYRVMAWPSLQLAGVVCERESREFPHHMLNLDCVFDFAKSHDVPVMDMSQVQQDVAPGKGYLGISVRFSKIIRERILNRFDRGIINLHGGELPRYRGVHSANHCILEGARWGGATIHFVDKGIDTGNIIARDRFPIEGLDTAHDVFVRTQESLMQLFEDLLPTLATGRLSSTPQQYYIDRGEIARTYYSTDIGSYRELTFAMNPEEVFRRARALDFPGHEPAHFLIDGKRLYVTTRTFFKEQLP